MLTKEENKLSFHAADNKFTIPNKVTPETPLESLNLNWKEKDLPERIRTKHVHKLHPYLGKFIPQLVEIFLRKYFKPGQTVLDPFAGSGTTLVQANELGINSIGYDVSAFNILLCEAKTVNYDIRKVTLEIYDILEKVRNYTQTNNQQLSPIEKIKNEDDVSRLPENARNYLLQWFAPQALSELLTYRKLIETGDYEYKNLLKIILSRSARSARLTTHFDLDFPKKPQVKPYWCYKHSRTCSPTTEALKFLNRYSKDTLKRIKEFANIRTNATVEIKHEDSREAIFPQIDGVITSPPYVGLINYHEQHVYAYHLLGLEDRRVKEIGSAHNGSSKTAQQLYQKDIAEVFRRTVNSMPKGGRLIIVAGDKHNLYEKIAGLIGVEIENTVKRHVNRRTGRRSSEFYESVYIWRKP